MIKYWIIFRIFQYHPGCNTWRVDWLISCFRLYPTSFLTFALQPLVLIALRNIKFYFLAQMLLGGLTILDRTSLTTVFEQISFSLVTVWTELVVWWSLLLSTTTFIQVRDLSRDGDVLGGKWLSKCALECYCCCCSQPSPYSRKILGQETSTYNAMMIMMITASGPTQVVIIGFSQFLVEISPQLSFLKNRKW